MPYSTVDDLKIYMSEDDIRKFSNDDPSIETINTVLVEALIVDADSEIDMYVSKKYKIPLTTIPPIIKRLSSVLTGYSLTRRNNKFELADKFITNIEYVDAMKTLEKISKGKIKLPIKKLSSMSIYGNVSIMGLDRATTGG